MLQNGRIKVSERTDINKLINQRKVLFVIIGILKMFVINLNHMFVINGMIYQ